MNFTQLDRLIHSNAERITLTSDVTLADGEESIYRNGIEIDLNGMIIDGCGHTIDACGKTRIFNVLADLQVVIKNVNFKNASHQQGAAINNHSKFLTLGCCTFENNSAIDGGAINNHAFLKAKGCDFINNRSKYSADIYNWDTLVLRECNFKNKSRNVIFNLGHIITQECLFETHHVIETKSVEFGKDRKVFEIDDMAMSFTQLKNLDYAGGEVRLDYNVVFRPEDEGLKNGITFAGPDSSEDDESCVFLDEGFVLDGRGHTIDAKGSARIFNIFNKDITLTFKNITFKNGYFPGIGHDALIDGGGVMINRATCIFENCQFLNNNASNFGGVCINDGGSMSFTDCKFESNHSEGPAGVIFNHTGSLDFKKCIFTNNSAQQAGAVISDFLGDLKFDGCLLEDNSTPYRGIIYTVHNRSFDFGNSWFSKNEVGKGFYLDQNSFFDVI